MTEQRATSDEFASLMERYQLRSNEGAKLVALLIRITPISVMRLYTRGLRRNDFELLEIKLERVCERYRCKPDELLAIWVKKKTSDPR